jgi:hypothetical protein
MAKWTRIKETETQDGHHYFKDESGAIACADNSMRNRNDPATSDDGLLVVNKREIEGAGGIVGVASVHGRYLSFRIPLVKGGEEGYSTGANIAEAAAVAKFFGVQLYVEEGEQRFLLIPVK